jgi:hypothetical protein
MSALARHGDEASRPLTAERVRAARRSRSDWRLGSAGRLRRAEAGTLTEMTRSLLRDARAVNAADARRRTLPGGR